MVSDQIKTLRELQHLVLIRDESARIGSVERTEEVSQKISACLERLDDEAVALYRRASMKSPVFLAPLSKGNCSACGLRVPASILQHIIRQDQYVICNNCGRLMYAPEVKATGIRTDNPDPKFLLSRFSSSKLMIPALKAQTREEAIAELCAHLAKEKVIANPEAVVEAALKREAILTTAVGCGLAFPHMRGVEEGVLTFAAGVSPQGIAWGEERVNLVFFTVLPVVASPFYLKLLAALASSFRDGEKLPFVLAASDAKTLWRELNKATRTAVKNI